MPGTPPIDARETAPASPGGAPPPPRLGRFELRAVLGRGGMGEVWKAWDPGIGRWCAVKILHAAGDDEIARFAREASTAAGLDHPNIARIYEVGEDSGRRFIAMQFIDGATIGPAGPVETAARIATAARAIAFAHERGIIHRDIKPDNLMIDREGRVFVMDFGLARAVDDAAVTRTGTIVGTPDFMSPEQARGEKLEGHTDVWSLGATLFSLLANRVPFHGKDIYDLLRKIQSEDPPALPGPADLARVVQKCLEKEPSARYGSATALADDLDRFVRNQPVLVARPSAWRRLRRRPLLLLALSLAGVVCLAAGAIALSTARASSARRDSLDRLNAVSRDCLDAALDLRRAGNLDGMNVQAATLDRACREAAAALPGSPEPDYHLGRLERARLRFGDALVRQDAALAKDPLHGPARYERIVLLARSLRDTLRDLEERALRVEGDRIASEGGLSRPLPAVDRLIASSPEAQALQRRLDADVALLSPPSACASGLQAWAAGRIDEARRLLAEAMALRPVAEEAVEVAAALEAGLGRFAEAEAIWSKGIDSDRGYLPFREGRGLCRAFWVQTLRAERADASRQLAGAIEDYDELVRLAPGVSRHWHLRGGARMTFGSNEMDFRRDGGVHWKAAMDDFRRAIELDAANGEAWSRLGAARLNVGLDRQLRGGDPEADYVEAWSAFDRALALRPTDARLRIWRGDLRVNRAALRRPDAPDQYKAAVEEFSIALRLDPASAEAWHKRAAAHGAWGQWEMIRGRDPSPHYEAAERDFRESLERHATRRFTLLRAAQVFANWGSWLATQNRDADETLAKSVDCYDRLLALGPGQADLLSARAEVHLNRGAHAVRRGQDAETHYRAALADAEEAVTRAPSNPKALRTRAIVRLERGLAAARSGADPLPDVEAVLRDCAALPSDDADGAVTQGRAHQLAAAWLEALQRDAAPRWRDALAAFERAATLGRTDLARELQLCRRKVRE